MVRIDTHVGRDAAPEPEDRIERVAFGDRAMALGWLLLGRPAPRDPAVTRFVRFAQDHGVGLDELWGLWRDGRLRSAMLIAPNPGRTAMVFVSPVTTWPSIDAAAAMIATACGAQDPGATTLIQTLLEPQQQLEQRAMRRAGFEPLAELTYMQCAAAVGRADPATVGPDDPDLVAHHWNEANRGRFERAILASYEETRDCPRLLGRRDIGDIIVGHRAAGRFDPGLWWAFERHGEPAAVLLLSDVPEREACELVYLGLSPAERGRGLGARLVRLAQAAAAARGARHLLLAVDGGNAPAVRLYKRTGFTACGTKLAMIYDTRPAVSEAGSA